MIVTENQAKAIASFANVAGDKNEVFALQCIKLEVIDGVAHVYSTNRYVIAYQSFETASEDFSVVLPPDVVKFLKTAKNEAELVVSEDSIEVSSNGQTIRSDVYKGVYPKIEEYVVKEPEAVAQEIPFTVDFDLFVKISKLVSSNDGKKPSNAYKIFVQGINERGSVNPIVLKRENVVVIVQPQRVK